MDDIFLRHFANLGIGQVIFPGKKKQFDAEKMPNHKLRKLRKVCEGLIHWVIKPNPNQIMVCSFIIRICQQSDFYIFVFYS